MESPKTENGVRLTESTHEIKVVVQNPEGLHMRPAMQFVDLAGSFDSKITVSTDDISVDGKSIMQMTMLAATCGTQITIRAEGQDASDAIETLRELIEEHLVDTSPPKEAHNQEGSH